VGPETGFSEPLHSLFLRWYDPLELELSNPEKNLWVLGQYLVRLGLVLSFYVGMSQPVVVVLNFYGCGKL
jgi:hypothetical protein